jgi:hypothetical protein
MRSRQDNETRKRKGGNHQSAVQKGLRSAALIKAGTQKFAQLPVHSPICKEGIIRERAFEPAEALH